ncbi:division abnormally delayed protein [Vespa velutina]|uniref:division abnormally delayed protein n=1 Tax=Vespa velutina TaxID=202808 RepID=UPI001FB48D07|nr:division abnormally delayed protein [Vespa velutina]
MKIITVRRQDVGRASSPASLILFLLFGILFGGCVDAVLSRLPRSLDHSKNETDCKQVAAFFENENNVVARLITTKQESGTTSPISKTICDAPCCGHEVEDHLRHKAGRDFHNLIHHHSRSLQGLLATTADALRETVTTLAKQSENKTLTLFDQVYRSMAAQSKPSIRALYQAMIDYVSPSNTPDSLQQPLTRELLQERFLEFFSRLFPVAYHHAVNPGKDDFTDKFKSCLYETIDEVQPFGDVPKQISKVVGKSLEATRVLIQALTLGKTVLDRTDSALFSGTSPQQESCYNALLRMTYCPRCNGIGATIRPCSGFCTNVMRGCLTESASELDLAWSGYVETVERLVVAVDGRNDPLGLNAERAVRQLDTRISDAIMHAMGNSRALEEKVRKLCGRSDVESPSSEISGITEDTIERSSEASLEMHAAAPPPSSSSTTHRTLPTKLHTQLGNFLASVARSRTFYGTLADTICEEHPDKHCWNGERVGEYSKTVVDSSLSAQRYNPEFTVTTASSTASYGNTNTSVLIDQLRHINQIVQSQLALAPDGGTPLAEEAHDGSGSGDRPGWRNKGDIMDTDDEDSTDDDREDEEISGSGMGPSTPDPSVKTNREFRPTLASSSMLMPSLSLILVFGTLVA